MSLSIDAALTSPSAAPARAARFAPAWGLAALVVVFAAALLPVAGSFLLHYVDERHYTDGALFMLQGRGWLTPHTRDGAPNPGASVPRFDKPVLAYWAVAASFRLLGVGTLAARLPFLLAGCAVLALTSRLALPRCWRTGGRR